MIPLDEALAIVLHESHALPAEAIALAEAVGRVLAVDVRADADLPPFDRAAMDGYALRAGAAAEPPGLLTVIGELRAGEWPSRAVGPGEAVRIMTGAPLPEGASAVQPVEQTRALEDGRRVEILTGVAPGAHVAPRGSEVRSGDVVLARGRRLDAAAIGVLAAVGVSHPLVARRPRVAVLPTGDELVPVDAVPLPGQIRNSNGPALAALAGAAGAQVRVLGAAADRKAELAAAIAEGLAADVLVVCGGVSAGDYDLVEPVLLEAGASVFFTGVAIKPGAPLVFGRRGETLVFGLPGNPVSAQVTGELFVRPCLLRLQGAAAVARPRVRVCLLAPLANRSGRTSHVPVRVRRDGERLLARPVRSAGSGDLVAHAKANALVVIEPSRARVEAGESAEAVLLESFLEDDGEPL